MLKRSDFCLDTSWLFVATFCLVQPLIAVGEVRVWKSKSGEHEIRATMISSDEESVKLKTEDGRILTVAFAKLSQVDREFVAAQTAAESDDAELKQLVTKFYGAVGAGNRLRQFLSDKGQASYDRSPTFFQDIRGPDRGKHPRVTAVRVNKLDQTAIARYQIRIGNKNWKMEMQFASQDDQWRVTGITGPGAGGTKNFMNLETAESTNDSINTQSSIARGQVTSPSPATVVQTPGTDAYAKGMCAKCHGEQGAGGPRGPDLTDSEWLHCDGSVAGIRQVLESGVAKEQLADPSRPFGMNPATNLVPETELDVLAEFVISLGSRSD